jgi:hypothetical protein
MTLLTYENFVTDLTHLKCLKDDQNVREIYRLESKNIDRLAFS